MSDAQPQSYENSPDATHVSVLFWIALMTAGLMYAAVALSPKVVDWIATRREFVDNHTRMIDLETEITYLEQVARTLETDPQFAAEVHRYNLLATAANHGDSPALPFAASTTLTEQPAALPSWYAGIAEIVARKSRLRTGLLIAAAGLTIAAFTLLNEPAAPAVSRTASALRAAALRLLSRYTAPPIEEQGGGDL